MEQPSRSLRPRASVDYADRTGVAQTPGWLKRLEPKVQIDPAVASKENQRPVIARTQPEAKNPAVTKPRRQSEPVADSNDSAAQKLSKVKPRPAAKQPAEQRSESSHGTQPSRSRSSTRQGRAATAAEDTSMQHLPTATDRERAARPAEHADSVVQAEQSQPAAAEQAGDRQHASKRKGRGASANNRSKKAKQIPKMASEGLSAELPHSVSPAKEPEQAEQLGTKEQEAAGPGDAGHQSAASPEPSSSSKQAAMPEQQQQQQQQQPPSEEPSANFYKLQEDYADLLSRYQELQNTHIHSLEEMLSEKNAEEEGHVDAATKMAEHWKSEAQDMETRLQASGVAALEQELQGLQQKLHDVEGRQLGAETQVLKEQEVVVQLTLALKAAQVASRSENEALLAELEAARQQTQKAEVADKDVQVDLMPPVTDASAQAPSLRQQRPAMALSALSGPGLTMQAAALPVKPQPVHMHEAKAVCPEGNDASEQYQAPVHVPGASWPAGSRPRPADAHIAREAFTGPWAAASDHALTPGAAQMAGNLMLELCSYQSPAVAQSAPVDPATSNAVHHLQDAHATATPPASNPIGLPHELVPYSAASAGSYHRTPLTRFAAEALMARGAVKSSMDLADPSSDIVYSQQGRTEGGTAPVGTAARQLQYPSGSGSEALQSAGGAVVLSAHQSDLSDAQPLAVSVAQEALETLVGLQGKPKGPHSFQYTHQQSGFTFELGPVPPSSESSSSDDDEDTGPDAAPAAMELEYNPVALGAASAVLPYYLCNYARFDARQKQKVVGRILDALGKWKPSEP